VPVYHSDRRGKGVVKVREGKKELTFAFFSPKVPVEI